MHKVKVKQGKSGKILLDTQGYDADTIEKIKMIPGRQWHPNEKIWSIPLKRDSIAQILKALGADKVDLEPSLFPAITEVTRRDIIDYLICMDTSLPGRLSLIDFLSRTWDLNSMPSTDSRFHSASGDIWQHMENNSDWDYSYLLYNYLGLLEADQTTFLKFIEQCVHPVVRNNEKEASKIVTTLNDMLLSDGYRLQIASRISGKPVYKARLYIPDEQVELVSEERYDVVLSFASEERTYVEAVADYLKEQGIRVFYDGYENEEVKMWGEDLAEVLDQIYRGNARYCVMFISQNYAKKVWPNYERKSAVAKAITEKQAYILPARFDATEVPGIKPTVKYIDLNVKTPQQLGQMILLKLGKSGSN